MQQWRIPRRVIKIFLIAAFAIFFGLFGAGIIFLHSKVLDNVDSEVRDALGPPPARKFTLESREGFWQKKIIDFDKEKPELTVWTRDPPFFPIIVTRRNHHDKLYEQMRVEFRICNPKTPEECPQEIPVAHQEAEYVLNNASIITIFENRTDVLSAIQHERGKRARPVDRSTVRISYWSHSLQKHVALGYEGKFMVTVCRGDTCPKRCPTFINQEPHKWDDNDNLCKSSDPAVLFPIRPFGGRCACETTCHTPQANEVNSTWPWKNQSQREFFHPRNTKTLTHHQMKKCKKDRKRETYAPRYTCEAGKQQTRLPCAAFMDAFYHFMFIPEAKLIFCGVPKVGFSEWLKFFRYTWGARDYLSHPHLKRDREEFLVGSLSIEKAEELLNDPSWTRAVFFRDPAERLLSAYLDKIVGEGYTKKEFNIKNPDMLSFPDFVDLVTEKGRDCSSTHGLHPCTNPHWKPQTMICGLDHLLPNFNFIGNFGHIAEHTKFLLQRVGFWDNYGATFRDARNQESKAKTNKKCMVAAPINGANNTFFGFNQGGPSKAVVHATGSSGKLDKYYTPELLAKVREAYALDYAIWDDIKLRDVTDVANGKDLESVRHFCKNDIL